MTEALTPEWESDMRPAGELNPHYHCSASSADPCPTGEHVNPYPHRDVDPR